VGYKFQTGNNKIKLITGHKSITQNVLFGIAVIAAMTSERKLRHISKWRLFKRKLRAYFQFYETKSVIKTQRRYRTHFGKDQPSDNAIRR
jgi:hypothetical protein